MEIIMEIPEINLYEIHNAEKSARFERMANARKHKAEEMSKVRKEQAYMRNQNVCRKIPHWDPWKNKAIRQERAVSRDRSAIHDFRDEMAEDNKLARLMAEYEEKKWKYEDDSRNVQEAIQMVRVFYGDEVLRMMRSDEYDADRICELFDLETRIWALTGNEVK